VAYPTDYYIEDVGPNVLIGPGQSLVTLWTALPLNAGWTNWGPGSYNAGQYRKVGDMVQLRGTIKHASGLGVAICTLPVGFRPPDGIQQPVRNPVVGGYFDIGSGGVITMQSDNAGDNTAAVSFFCQFSVTP
jgi:hypothetical protein